MDWIMLCLAAVAGYIALAAVVVMCLDLAMLYRRITR